MDAVGYQTIAIAVGLAELGLLLMGFLPGTELAYFKATISLLVVLQLAMLVLYALNPSRKSGASYGPIIIIIAYAVLLCAGLCAMAFVFLYVSSPEWAWLFQHLAFILLLSAGQLLFFWYHSFENVATAEPPREDEAYTVLCVYY
jgi:hypothetical protein